MDYLGLRKSQILLLKEEKALKSSDFENLLKKTKITDEKWFFRGCRHMVERHYTEALKNLQLSNTKDAVFLCTLISLKLADSFLLENYLEELRKDQRELQILNKYNLKVAFKYKNSQLPVSPENIQNLISSILNR